MKFIQDSRMEVFILLLVFTTKVIDGKPAIVASKHPRNVFDQIIAANSYIPASNGNDGKHPVGGIKASSQGRTLFEADIVMTNELRSYLTQQKAERKATNDVIRNGRWKDGVVPYTFDTDFEYQEVVEEAIQEYHEKSCIRFVKRTTETDYLNFHMGGGCWSFIGHIGGKQAISLDYGCGYKGIAMHEMLHALGFFHEQSRLDRDKYIKINWDNIKEDMEHNFKKHDNGEATDMGEAYDKESIMHYGNYAFAVDYDIMTIESKSDPEEMFGQREALSKIDLKQLNKYYKCKGPETTKTTTITTMVPTTTKTTTTTTTPTTTTQKTTTTSTPTTTMVTDKKEILTPKPKTTCIDKMACCKVLAVNGLCSKSNWVKDNCKMSCYTCPIEKTKTTTTSTTPETSTTMKTTTTPTTTPSTTTTPDSTIQEKCFNEYGDSDCNTWAKRNEFCDHKEGCCDVNSGTFDFMNQHCQKSCGLCAIATTTTTTTTATTPTTKDKCRNENTCEEWSKRNEHCDYKDGCCHKKSDYFGYMKDYCQKSCGFC